MWPGWMGPCSRLATRGMKGGGVSMQMLLHIFHAKFNFFYRRWVDDIMSVEFFGMKWWEEDEGGIIDAMLFVYIFEFGTNDLRPYSFVCFIRPLVHHYLRQCYHRYLSTFIEGPPLCNHHRPPPAACPPLLPPVFVSSSSPS